MTIAAAIIEAGADVFCCDILDSPSPLEWKALQLKASQYGAIARYYQVDITDVIGVTDCFATIAAQSRYPINGFLSCAATQHEQLAIDYDMDKFRSILQINVDGTMATAQAAARLMRDSGRGGSILLIASMSGAVANRVSLASPLFHLFPIAHTMITSHRACIARHTTLPKRQSYNSVDLSPLNGPNTISESIHSVLVTFEQP